MTNYNSHWHTFKNEYLFLFFFFSFYTEKGKVVVKEDRQSEGIEEQVMVDESDVEESIILKKEMSQKMKQILETLIVKNTLNGK